MALAHAARGPSVILGGVRHGQGGYGMPPIGIGALLALVVLALVVGPFGTLLAVGFLVALGLVYRFFRTRR